VIRRPARVKLLLSIDPLYPVSIISPPIVAGTRPGKSTIYKSSTIMIELTLKWQLILAGSGCMAIKAAGVTMALTKGGCLGHRKHLLTLREKRGSGGIVSGPKKGFTRT
jgi:hypothetical protein